MEWDSVFPCSGGEGPPAVSPCLMCVGTVSIDAAVRHAAPEMQSLFVAFAAGADGSRGGALSINRLMFNAIEQPNVFGTK